MKISIIIPVYNAEKLIVECLSSIQGQTLPDWECICVDDGSSDNSVDVINGFAENDARFRLIRQENGGPGVARNTGLDAAKGRYYTFVDADDLIHAEMLERMVCCAEETQSDLVLARFEEFEGDDANTSGTLASSQWSSVAGGIDAQLIQIMDYKRHFSQPWGKLYRQEAHKGWRFPGLYGPEDMYVMVDMYAASRRTTVLGDVLYYYREEGGSLFRNGFKTYKTYIAAGGKVGSHYEEVCLEAGASRDLTLKLVRKFGTGAVMLHLLDGLSDSLLTEEEKEICIQAAKESLSAVCAKSCFGWRALPVKYWHLYPGFVRKGRRGLLSMTVVLRNLARTTMLEVKRAMGS